MNKTMLTASIAIMALTAAAAPLTPEQALARYSREGGDNGTFRAPAASALKLVSTGKWNNQNSYYVFSGNRQSLILSADDQAAPLLGYLDTEVDASTPVPPQLNRWLHVASQGKTPAYAPVGKIEPLIKSTWDQLAPYNNLCPGGCPTGCVATAMAQVMKYHEYPQVGTGTVTATYNNREYTMTLDDAPFSWSDMLLSYPESDSGTASQRDAVATLMKAAGYAVNTAYEKDSSGAYSWDIPHALVNNFGYDNSAVLYMRDFFAPETWMDMIYGELSAGRPVLYSGTGTDGGHQFVCDGYDANGYFHFNWGWSGYYDGLFLMTDLNPGGQGTGGNSDGFTTDQDATFGLTVNGGMPSSEPYLGLLWGELHASKADGGIMLTFGSDEYAGIFNVSGKDFKGVFGISVKDAEGNVKEYDIDEDNIPLSSGIVENWFFYMPEDCVTGTYDVTFFTRNESSSVNEPIKFYYNTPDMLRVVMRDGNISSVKAMLSKNAGDPTVSEYEMLPYQALSETDTEADIDWNIEDVLMPSAASYIWKWDSYNNSSYFKASAYIKNKNYAAESYVYSPVIDMTTNVAPIEMTFDHAAKFQNGDLDEEFNVAVREAGTDEWTIIPIPYMPVKGKWDFSTSGIISLDDWAGKKVEVGFRYKSSTSGADTWEVRNVKITGARQDISGIGQINGDEYPVQWFDLQGRRLQHPSGLCIRVQGGNAEKVIK